MTSEQEKAKQLVKMYNKLAKDFTRGVSMKEFSKQCALIAVGNIILANPHSNPFNTDVYSTMDYWIEVKKEIENL